MLTKIKWLLLGIGFSLISCDEGLLRSAPEPIPIPRVTRPYVALFLSPASPTINVILSKVTPASGEGYEPNALGLPDATVTIIREDGQTLLVPYRGGIQHRVSNDGFVQAGRRYRLIVKTPQGDQVEGTCLIPSQNIDAGQVRVEDLGDARLRVSWSDVTLQADYYALLNGGMQTNTRYRDTIYTAIDPLTVLTDALAAPNRRITSPTLNRTFEAPEGSGNNNFNNIVICRTDSAYFAYHKTFADKEAARQNPFAEPVNLYSNIKGGYGIMAGYVGIRIVCKGSRIVQVR